MPRLAAKKEVRSQNNETVEGNAVMTTVLNERDLYGTCVPIIGSTSWSVYGIGSVYKYVTVSTDIHRIKCTVLISFSTCLLSKGSTFILFLSTPKYTS